MSDLTGIQIALAQLNPVVGDFAYNLQKAIKAVDDVAGQADLLVFPEMYICGYPTEDLVYRRSFIEQSLAHVQQLARYAHDKGVDVLIGTPSFSEKRLKDGRAIAHNSVALLMGGKIATIRHKHVLPNNGVFDEKRTFIAGTLPEPILYKGHVLGVAICEDIWREDVCAALKSAGAQVLLVINGSPFEMKKHEMRLDVVQKRITETGLPLVYLNMVGGQDELVFDGGSFALNHNLNSLFQLNDFKEKIFSITYPFVQETSIHLRKNALWQERMYQTCVLGLRDYVRKSGFTNVLLGLSGGVDSALVAVMAVDALGAEQVRTFMLPSQYTAQMSFEDAAALAQGLGCSHEILPIEPIFTASKSVLAEPFLGLKQDITEENMQSRIRGVLLMALSNKLGALLLTTGNKSEMATGFATLYGDMNGAYNPIKDVYKTQVYELCRWRMANYCDGFLGPKELDFPQRILTRAPSAELAPNQKDQDRLPPYDVLDAILEQAIENDASQNEVVAMGFEPKSVAQVFHLLRLSEYKRRQSAPGPKIGCRSFGRDWRMPLVNRFKG